MIGFSFLNRLDSFIICADDPILSAVSSLISDSVGRKFVGFRSPIGEESGEDNFSSFIDKLRINNDVPIIAGSADSNIAANYIESKFKQTIELSGIVALSTKDGSIVLENRHGTFSIGEENSARTIYPCLLLRLRDFQKDCIYIAGHGIESLIIGAFALSHVFNDTVVSPLAEDDAFLVRGSVVRQILEHSDGCHSFGDPVVDPASVTVQLLRQLNENVPNL